MKNEIVLTVSLTLVLGPGQTYASVIKKKKNCQNIQESVLKVMFLNAWMVGI